MTLIERENLIPAHVITAWGESNENASYSLKNNALYFQTKDDGMWCNYEPQQIEKYRLYDEYFQEWSGWIDVPHWI